MRLVRSIAFLAGALPVAALIIALNFHSYQAASSEFYEMGADTGIWFSHSGFYWGFPIASFYEGTCFPCRVWIEQIAIGSNVSIWILTMVIAGYSIKRLVEKRFISLEK